MPCNASEWVGMQSSATLEGMKSRVVHPSPACYQANEEARESLVYHKNAGEYESELCTVLGAVGAFFCWSCQVLTIMERESSALYVHGSMRTSSYTRVMCDRSHLSCCLMLHACRVLK